MEKDLKLYEARVKERYDNSYPDYSWDREYILYVVGNSIENAKERLEFPSQTINGVTRTPLERIISLKEFEIPSFKITLEKIIS